MDAALVVHCAAFIEMLGWNSAPLRAHIKCLRQLSDTASFPNTDMFELIVTQSSTTKSLDLDSLKTALDVRHRKMPSSLLDSTLIKDGWFHFLLFATNYEYSLDMVLAACHRTNIDVAKNIARAIQYDVSSATERCRRNSSAASRHRKKSNVGGAGAEAVMSASIGSANNEHHHQIVHTKLQQNIGKFLDNESDLFAVILQCAAATSLALTEQMEFQQFLELIQTESRLGASPSFQLNLLQNAITKHWPVLAILAADAIEDVQHHLQNRQFCWFIWLSESVHFIPFNENGSFSQMATDLLEFSVRQRFVRTLWQSYAIFYPNDPIALFAEFLCRTGSEFDFTATELLQRFLMIDPLVTAATATRTSQPVIATEAFHIHLLLLHIQHGFVSAEHRQLLLDSLCEAGIADCIDIVDLAQLRALHSSTLFTATRLDVTQFNRLRCTADNRSRYAEQIVESLIAEHEYTRAMEVADLLGLPKDNIIFESWVWEYERRPDMDLSRAEREIDRYSLSPELVINFYVHVADRLPYEDPQKYRILKMVMDVVKMHHLFPNETFNCDRIELEMVISFLRNDMAVSEVDIYYSEYFESIMSKERSVLYKSFPGLKELAAIDDLPVTNKVILTAVEVKKFESLIDRLLDAGDLVQALRLQAQFNHRTLDLHFLVYCMALSEGLVTLYDLSQEQRQMFSDGVKSAISRFNRRTLQQTGKRESAGNKLCLKLTLLNKNVIKDGKYLSANFQASHHQLVNSSLTHHQTAAAAILPPQHCWNSKRFHHVKNKTFSRRYKVLPPK